MPGACALDPIPSAESLLGTSIRKKLIAFNFCLVLTVVGGLSLYGTFQKQAHVLSSFEQEGEHIARLLAELLINDLYFVNLEGLRQQLKSARSNPDITYVYVTDIAGAALTDANRKKDRTADVEAFQREVLSARQWKSKSEEDAFRMGGPVLLPDRSIGGYLFVEFSLERVRSVAAEETRAGLILMVVGLAAGALLAFALAAHFTRPIHSIMAAATGIGAGVCA